MFWELILAETEKEYGAESTKQFREKEKCKKMEKRFDKTKGKEKKKKCIGLKYEVNSFGSSLKSKPITGIFCGKDRTCTKEEYLVSRRIIYICFPNLSCCSETS